MTDTNDRDADNAARAVATPKLSMGAVIRGTFGVLKRNFTTYFVLILALFLAPALPIVLGVLQVTATHLFAGVGLITVGAVLVGVGACILQASLIYAAIADLNGRRASLEECLRAGLRNFLPLIGIIVMMFLAFFVSVGVVAAPALLIGKLGAAVIVLFVLGMFAYYVALVMVAVAWCLAFPAQVVERTGVFGAFTRSGRLTKHNRWRILGLFLLWTIVSSVVQGVLTNLTGAGGFTAVPGAPLGGLGALSPAYWVVMAIMSVVSAMVTSAGIATIYFELRRVKEGVGPETLASVFD